jgi:hypothetical protein
MISLSNTTEIHFKSGDPIPGLEWWRSQSVPVILERIKEIRAIESHARENGWTDEADLILERLKQYSRIYREIEEEATTAGDFNLALLGI